MATTNQAAIANGYQKYFTKELLKHAVQLTVMDQFALKQDLPKGIGSKIISFFRRTKSVLATSGTGAGLVANVSALTEGTPIATFNGATMDRVDITLVQLGEASKITDIVSMTQLFDALKQNINLMGEDCALDSDSRTRNALVGATASGFVTNTTGPVYGNGPGLTLTQGDGSTTTTEYIQQMYAQSLASYSALNSAGVTDGKATAADFIRAATQLKINRAPAFEGGMYVGVISPQIVSDLQNDPDWQESANYGEPGRRFKGEIKNYGGVRFVEHTNPFMEDATGTEGKYAIASSASDRVYRSFILGQGAYGVPKIAGGSPFSPQVIIVDRPDKSDPLNQFKTVGWKSFWAASAVNCPYAISLSSKTEFAG